MDCDETYRIGQQIARQLGIGDEHCVGIAGHRQDVGGGCALRHPHVGIDSRERRERRIERGKDAVGNGDHRAGHGQLRFSSRPFPLLGESTLPEHVSVNFFRPLHAHVVTPRA